MASGTDLPSSFSGFTHNLPTFESNIKEDEAQKDLTELPLSDDELFVDLDVPEVAGEGNAGQPSPSGSAVSAAGTDTRAGPAIHHCCKCQRTYKRQYFLDRHEKTCQGIQRKRFKRKDAVDNSTKSEYEFCFFLTCIVAF